MSAIFISYRRSGAKQTAYRLKDKLKEAFGDDKVFLDLEDIRGGARFAEVIKETIAKASVVLVVIGPKWLDIGAAEGRRRLDEQDDWVRQEVEAALQSDAEVIPVLVDGATEIDVGRLPQSIRELASRNFVEISPKETHWHFDTDRLIGEIESVDPGLAKQSHNKKLPLSGKAIWSLVLVLLLIFIVAGQQQEAMDHDSAVGGIAFAVVALVLGIWAYFDVQAERVRGKGAAISGIAMGILATLAMIGSLPQPGQAPIAAVPPTTDASPAPNTLIGSIEDIDVNKLPPTAAIPGPPAAVDISGVWISTDGLLYRVRQDGRSFSFDEYDDGGNLVGNGTGVIQGTRVNSEFQSSVEGPGRSQLVISDDGQRMSGSYQLLSSGESGQTILLRQ